MGLPVSRPLADCELNKMWLEFGHDFGEIIKDHPRVV
jgi:hypothetical protein